VSLVQLPNIRKIFVPDQNYVIFDADLSGADAQVVAWEAGDEDLKTAFRAGVKIHLKNCEDMFNLTFSEEDLRNEVHKSKSNPKGKKYDECKRAVHATNYGASANTLSRTPEIAWTVHESHNFQRKWFGLHPGIKKWHDYIANCLKTNRTVENKFGYRRIFFDRIDSVFPEALAWIPQSTVALVTFRGAEQLERECPWAEILMQVHDSLVFQVPSRFAQEYGKIYSALRVPIPYADELIIPWGLASSPVSWGDCKAVKELRPNGALN